MGCATFTQQKAPLPQGKEGLRWGLSWSPNSESFHLVADDVAALNAAKHNDVVA